MIKQANIGRPPPERLQDDQVPRFGQAEAGDNFFLAIVSWIARRLRQNQEEDQEFLLSVDVDGAKVMIFLNTVFMNNFSISKKLCTTDAATCLVDPHQFRFEFGKIFSRKPLKKIKRNVISKLARLLVTKAVMRYQWPDIDDIVFIVILLFHQLSFLYYIQMNSQTNYLRFCSESVYFMCIQKIIKKYSKGLSLLVKVNNSVMTGGYTFSLKIFEFLFRMWLSHFIKSIIIMRATKSREKINRSKLTDVLKYQLAKVVMPTFVLYVSVI